MHYTEISIALANNTIADDVMAQLLLLGFESFEETDTALKAYTPTSQYNKEAVATWAAQHNHAFTETDIPPQNWNELWETSFSLIQVNHFVGIRAHFHAPMQGVQHEIVITPKMSFGTGHHATTYMMMQWMEQMIFSGKTVFDYGTGTGILAILAEKLGAKQVLAIDYDDWCIDNASENIAYNHCQHIQLLKADTAATDMAFDIVLANINKNIILDNGTLLAKAVASSGELILSGLLQEDETDILHAMTALGGVHKGTLQQGQWIALGFQFS